MVSHSIAQNKAIKLFRRLQLECGLAGRPSWKAAVLLIDGGRTWSTLQSMNLGQFTSQEWA